MKKFTIQIVGLLLVIFISFYFYVNPDILSSIFGNITANSTAQVKINDNLIHVEIADNASKRGKGLSDRESLASDSGMLFTFNKPDIYTFWMKGMKFPLDMIWIREKKVVDMSLNVAVPSPGQTDESLPRYQPKEPADMVLEVNGGYAIVHNIKVGDLVEIK